MAENILLHQLSGITVGVKTKDGYVNATALTKAYRKATGTRREVSEWLSNARTKESLKHLSSVTGIPVCDLYRSSTATLENGGGTWLHPMLANRFAIWLSDEYGFQVEQWLTDWRNSKVVYPPALTKEEMMKLLVKEKPSVWSKQFSDEYYHQLSRLTGLVQTGNARPYHWANLTIELFYNNLPGEITLILKAAKKKRGNWQKLHQFLTEEGRKVFAAHMEHLLNAMSDADSINDVRRALRNRYGDFNQGEFFLDNRKDGALSLRKSLIAELN